MFDRFNVDYSGFIHRIPKWVFSAIRELDIFVSLVNETVDGEVADYKCAIPDNTKVLMGISYLGSRLPRTEEINMKTNDESSKLAYDYHSYTLDNNGYIITTFEECDLGELKFYIKKVNTELDTDTNIYFPLIPDNEDLITALEWYILKRLLERGHKIREFSLSANNEYLNPAIAWDKWKHIARNSVARIDADTREELSRLQCTLLTNKYYYSTEQFNNTNYGD